MGRRLIKKLIEEGFALTALVRSGSEHKLPEGVTPVIADPFDASTFQHLIPTHAVFVQLLGVPLPSPRKREQFRTIDLRSVKASADAAAFAGVQHFVYVSVAMTPSAQMKDYQEVRQEGEAYLLSKGFACTFVRPWYVVGPGHWWPILLLPVYGIAELKTSWRQKARGMALVTIKQMVRTLVNVVMNASQKNRVVEIRQIRQPALL